jgi:hypothetical protein
MPSYEEVTQRAGSLRAMTGLARLLPFSQVKGCQKNLVCLTAAPASEAAGARAYRIMSCHEGESFEHSWGAAGV